ncbi:MAG: hypothetical protein DME19_15670 [Verrucomicrobia bacterium]|nr:MAG: hypothetical protein DME19_15670 [Verrucomicrobiota bacterium]
MNTKPPECWALQPQARGLRVELTPDHSFVVPYEHFIYSEYLDREGEEVLKLVFATHEIVLNGKLLRRVEAALHKRELASVAAVAEKFRSVLEDTQPFIQEIAVISPTSAEEVK